MSQSTHIIKILYMKLNPIPKRCLQLVIHFWGWNTSLPLPPGHLDSELAESFNIFLTSKISKIRPELNDLRIGPPDTSDVNHQIPPSIDCFQTTITGRSREYNQHLSK